MTTLIFLAALVGAPTVWFLKLMPERQEQDREFGKDTEGFWHGWGGTA